MKRKGRVGKAAPKKQKKQVIEKKPTMFHFTEVPERGYSFDVMTVLAFPPKSRVRKINELAFAHCSMLKKVVLNGVIREIGNKCFFRCDKLNKIRINGVSRLKIINDKAFKGTQMKHFNYPPSMKKSENTRFAQKNFKISIFQARISKF